MKERNAGANRTLRIEFGVFLFIGSDLDLLGVGSIDSILPGMDPDEFVL
jgi:hypothetical protein